MHIQCFGFAKCQASSKFYRLSTGSILESQRRAFVAAGSLRFFSSVLLSLRRPKRVRESAKTSGWRVGTVDERGSFMEQNTSTNTVVALLTALIYRHRRWCIYAERLNHARTIAANREGPAAHIWRGLSICGCAVDAQIYVSLAK